MKLRWAVIGLSGLASMAAACADDAVVTQTTSEVDGGTDAASLPVDDGGDAPVLDAGKDGSADADAGPTTCSADDYCWTALPTGLHRLWGVWSDGANTAFATTEEGEILRWDGVTWTIAFTTDTGKLSTVWASSATNVWAGGVGGLFHGEGPSPDKLTWTHVAFDEKAPVLSIGGTSATDVWAVGSYYTFGFPLGTYVSVVRHLTSGDANSSDAWVRDPISDRSGQVQRVLVQPNGDTWLFGDVTGSFYTVFPAFILHRVTGEGGEKQFVEVPGPVNDGDKFYEVDNVGLVGDEIRVVGWLNKSRVTASWRGATTANPDERTWTEDLSLPTIYHHWGGVWGTGPNDVYLASEFGRLRHYDGAKWSYPRISIDGMPVTNDFYSMFAVPHKELWVVGRGIALHKVFKE